MMDKLELRKKALKMGKMNMPGLKGGMKKDMEMNDMHEMMMGDSEEDQMDSEGQKAELVSFMVTPKEKMFIEQMRKRKKSPSVEISVESGDSEEEMA